MSRKFTVEKLVEQFFSSLPAEETKQYESMDEAEITIPLLKYYLSQNPGDNMLENFLSGSNLDGAIPSAYMTFTPSGTTRATFLYLQALSILTCPATASTKRENFNSYLLLEVLDGEGYLEYEKKELILGLGDIMLIDCRKYHYIHTTSEFGWTYRVAHFDGISMVGIFSRFLHSQCFVFSGGKNQKAKDLFSQLFEINRIKSENNEILTNCVLVQIVTELLLQCPSPEKETPDWIQEIQDYLKKNFLKSSSLDSLEARFNRSKYHICHEFKRYTGKTIQQYITIQRMARAEELMQYTNLSNSEISFLVGYENSSSFSKAFSKQYNMTPGMYRKQFQMISH